MHCIGTTFSIKHVNTLCQAAKKNWRMLRVKTLVNREYFREVPLISLLSILQWAEVQAVTLRHRSFHQKRGLAANEEAVLTAGTWGNTLSCSPQPGTGKVYCTIPAFGKGNIIFYKKTAQLPFLWIRAQNFMSSNVSWNICIVSPLWYFVRHMPTVARGRRWRCV